MNTKGLMTKDALSPYKMNLPTDLKGKLQKAADRSGRSLSSEIITRLEASVSISDEGGIEFTLDSFEQYISEAIGDALDDYEQRIQALEAIAAGRDPYNRED